MRVRITSAAIEDCCRECADFVSFRIEGIEIFSIVFDVIPAKAGIQVSNIILRKVYNLDSRFRGNDVFGRAGIAP